MKPKVLRCFAEQSGSSWEATCIDLDVSVQGDSFEEVHRDLLEAIAVYLETVRELPEPERVRLLNRRAPFWRRFQLVWAHLRYFVFGTGRARARHDFVTDPALCPT